MNAVTALLLSSLVGYCSGGISPPITNTGIGKCTKIQQSFIGVLIIFVCNYIAIITYLITGTLILLKKKKKKSVVLFDNSKMCLN